MGLLVTIPQTSHLNSCNVVMHSFRVEAPGGVEPPTNGLGNRCSIQLSYGATLLKRLLY
jgi:hypothetical protein